MRALIALVMLAVATPVAAQTIRIEETGTPAAISAKDQIMGVMAVSAAGWNAGDVDAFLGVYSDDPGTSFAGSDGVAYGKAGIRARYIKGYPGQFGPDASAATRSVLTFIPENFRLVGEDHALLIARWKLVKPNGEVSEGMTSLIFRAELMGWKIIADHSS